jgi:hypothetical protein
MARKKQLQGKAYLVRVGDEGCRLRDLPNPRCKPETHNPYLQP